MKVVALLFLFLVVIWGLHVAAHHVQTRRHLEATKQLRKDLDP